MSSMVAARSPGENKLAMDIEKLKWALIIYLGDEEASFQTEKICHPNAIYWVQEPLMGKHDFRIAISSMATHTGCRITL